MLICLLVVLIGYFGQLGPFSGYQPWHRRASGEESRELVITATIQGFGADKEEMGRDVRIASSPQ